MSSITAIEVSVTIILLVALTSAVFGLRYLFATQYMSYHAQLTGWAWPNIPGRIQSVILGMLKIVGAGMLAFGISLAWLTVPFSRSEPWAAWAILSVVAVNGLVSVYVTISLKAVDRAVKTNVLSAIGGVVLVIVALGIAKLK